MKSASRIASIVGLLALLLGGCRTTPTMRVEAKPGVDTSKFQTFAVLPMTEAVPGADPRAMKAAVPVIEGVIRSAFLSRGYREAMPDKADFTVVLNAGFLPQVNASDWGYIPGYVGSGWYSNYSDFMAATSVTVSSYDQTVIALQVFDVKTKEMIWVAFGTAMKKEKATYSQRLDRAAESLTTIIQEFPQAGSSPAPAK